MVGKRAWLSVYTKNRSLGFTLYKTHGLEMPEDTCFIHAAFLGLSSSHTLHPVNGHKEEPAH